MGYRTLRACVQDLQRTGQLIVVDDPVDARLEVSEIHRRVFRSQGPALLFTRVHNCRFPMVSNLFGTEARTHFLFRDTLDRVQQLVKLKTDPGAALRHPWRSLSALRGGWHMLPRRTRRAPILKHETHIDQLPQQVSWPDDGGAFITLPLVYTEDVEHPGMMRSNLGMYRIQLSGGSYQPNTEIGLHYQLHRGIGVHHAAALRQGLPFRVQIFVGGAPAAMVAAVMPLPEGLSELGFAGALGGYRFPMVTPAGGLPIYAEADFCICGTVESGRLLPEGPFGDHLGYYSLVHDFPVLKVERVYHRPDPIWPFTVVGRPPQEDTMFGKLIHDLTGPVIPTVLPGVHAVHAVDAAGVHPLLLAIGNERYVPYEQRDRPRELLTQAHAILGQGQLSLAKYLLIVAHDDDPQLRIADIPAFFRHLLLRIDWQRDLHFQTRTTVDTLDYSGTGLNEGSKVVMAAVGQPRRQLPVAIPSPLRLPTGFGEPRAGLPGILLVQGPNPSATLSSFCRALDPQDAINQFPLVVLVDDSDFSNRSWDNFLWTTFTRSNPAVDMDGIGAAIADKHWGCSGSLVIDARIKPHHAPPLLEDPATTRRVDALASRGKEISRWL